MGLFEAHISKGLNGNYIFFINLANLKLDRTYCYVALKQIFQWKFQTTFQNNPKLQHYGRNSIKIKRIVILPET